MTLSKSQLADLLRMLRLTKDQEATCGECHQAMAEFAEMKLEGRTTPERLKAIKDHLELCGECRKDLDSLMVIQ